MKTTHRALSSALAALVTLTLAGTSLAGVSYGTQQPYVYKSADGSGYVAGTLMQFRNATESTAAIFFDSWSQAASVSGWTMTASLNGSWYGCAIPASLASQLNLLLSASPTAYFNVTWNAQGECTELSVELLSAQQ